MGEALTKHESGHLKSTASGAIVSGEVLLEEDGRASYYDGLDAAVSGDTISRRNRGVIKLAKATATTFSKGDPVYFDASVNQAVNPALTLDGGADFYCGVCAKAAVSGDTTVDCDINVQPIVPLMPMCFVYEFDCETGVDSADHVLIPAEYNKRGLVIYKTFALVTEVFAGATQDQGIVTVSDESNNALSTLTALNVSADAIGDVLAGANSVEGAASGVAVKTVAAGEFIDAKVTQVTSGAGVAGKMKVFVMVLPLV